jgi:hypothetical protein
MGVMLLRDEELKKSLVDQAIEFFRATGGSGDMKHSEPGYGCVVDLETATVLGTTWQQDAVFWIVGDDLNLVSCSEADSMVELGSFRERVIS